MSDLSDDELRDRLSHFMNGDVPPITDATRPSLVKKLESFLTHRPGRPPPQKKTVMTAESKPIRPAVSGSPSIETFVFFDLEATGINSIKTRITELSMIAIHMPEFLALEADLEGFKTNKFGGFGVESIAPRVQNKLTLCVYPSTLVPPKVTDVTGLDNYNLEGQNPFGVAVGPAVNAFLRHLKPPVCFVAHNGNGYDYPLFLAELRKAGVEMDEEVRCVDSLVALRHIHSEQGRVDAELRAVEDIMKRGGFDDDEQLMDVDHDPLTDRGAAGLDEDVDGLAEEQSRTPVQSPAGPSKQPSRPQKHGTASSNARERAKRRLDFDSSGPPSFSLPLLHEHLFGKRPRVSHGAEADCLAMMRVCGLTGRQFVHYANENWKAMKTIKPMW